MKLMLLSLLIGLLGYGIYFGMMPSPVSANPQQLDPKSQEVLRQAQEAVNKHQDASANHRRQLEHIMGKKEADPAALKKIMDEASKKAEANKDQPIDPNDKVRAFASELEKKR